MHRQIRHLFLQNGRKKLSALYQVVSKKQTLVIAGGGLMGAVVVADPKNERLAKYGGAIRFMRSLKTGLYISLDYFFSQLGIDENTTNGRIMMSRVHQRAADRILDACLKNGGCYIKLGQGLCSLGHILPKEYVQTLKILQDKCLIRTDDELYRLFEQDFGQSPNDIYERFDPKPIAAASLAQVFRASTKDGAEVAVKVQYIDLQSRFKSDIATIDFLLKLVGVIHPNFNFGWVLADLKSSLEQELDFVNEGKNSERCAADLKKFKYIYVPKVFWDLTSKRVLVTEFIDGYKITDKKSIRALGISLQEIDRKLFEAFGEQIFKTGFVHADPHPGNVLIRKKNRQAEVVLIDHGLYQQLEENHRIALGQMWTAIVLNDHEKMKAHANELGVTDYQMLAEILTQAPLKSNEFKLKIRLTDQDLKHITEFAAKRFDKIMQTLREMPRSLLLVVRNLNTIRAIARSHGDPIDRYTTLARAAKKAVYIHDNTLEAIQQLPIKVYFEIMLYINKIARFIFDVTLGIVNYLYKEKMPMQFKIGGGEDYNTKVTANA